MTKRIVEIEDTLQDRVDGAIEEIKAEFLSYLDQNPDTEKAPDWSDLDYSSTLHQIIDGSVPIYTSEIADIMYLHGDDVEQAFDDAGIGEKKDGQNGFPWGWGGVPSIRRSTSSVLGGGCDSRFCLMVMGD